MKLWEIKAQSLRLMFADYDMLFNKEEFENGTLENNPNTREKLVRMGDSIRRGIDLFYQYVGEQTQENDFSLNMSGEDYLNKIDLSGEELFGYPIRVDVYFYNLKTNALVSNNKQINFVYNSIEKSIWFETDYARYAKDYFNVSFKIFYKMKKINVPEDADDLTYDLNDLYLPVEVQRMLPYFVKGELYEEDEYSVAQVARGQYMQFLLSLEKPFSRVQTKISRSKVFEK